MAFEEPIVLEIPAERVIIRQNGADVEAFAFRDLWIARYADGSIMHVSNPLSDVALKGRAEDAPPTPVFFRLVPTNNSNPGTSDDFTSLTYDHWRISG